MNLQEMKAYKQKLITEGHGAYPTLAKIVDTLGEFKTISGREYAVLEHNGITAIHSQNIIKAKVDSRGLFQDWIRRDYLFITVGDVIPMCPNMRRDLVMRIYLDKELTEVTQADRDNEIFVPYHMDWYNRVLSLLPKVESILGESSKENSKAEIDKLSKELFLEEIK